MLSNLQHQSAAVTLDFQSVQDGRKISFELDVDNGTNDRANGAEISFGINLGISSITADY
jgi:hypothetical protein